MQFFKYPKRFWAGAMLWLAVITWLSTAPAIQFPSFNLLSADKLAHAAAYAMLTLLLLWAGPARWWWMPVVASAYGMMMEWVQATFFPGRFFEYDDMIANALGAFSAYSVALLLRRIWG
jgi:VanZ family protein